MVNVLHTPKKKFSLWKITMNIFIIIAAILLSWVAFHHVMNRYEQHKYPALGQLVDVAHKNMHVYTKGEGEHTIVLLPGLGTAAPVLDFEPLMNELAKTNKVVVVEPFGYGWSDPTNKGRTVENIVEEIRTALQKSNIEGPYILMPHSVSGIYSMYYANTYPEEIEAIIGNDCTLPKAVEYFNEPALALPQYMSLLEPTGMTRLVSYFMSDIFLPESDTGTYSDENIKMTKTIFARKGSNNNVVAEANEMENNIIKTKDMSFPSNLPVMIFARDRKDKVSEDGKTNLTFYESQ